MRALVIYVDLGDVSDYTASKLADQILDFASNASEGAEIIAEGVVSDSDAYEARREAEQAIGEDRYPADFTRLLGQ